MAYRFRTLGWCSLLVLAPFACSPEPGGSQRNRPGSAGASNDGNTGGSVNVGIGSGGGGGDIMIAPPTPNCGSGTLESDEACDDGNQESGDGCGSNCRYIEEGYVCAAPGEPCRPYAKCGDGIVVFPEQCDDGGLAPGDGCSPSCKVEIGFKCEGSPSTCSATVCGDGVIEGAETCDDGNAVPFDGCSEICQAEPACTADGCTSSCGDGLVIGAEECDDGNTLDGDGCSSTCVQEPGYTCTQSDACETVNGVCVLRLPIIYRDFSSAHSDFGVSCGEHVLGVANDRLSAAGKPTLRSNTNVCINSAASYAEWYTASSSSTQILGEIVLFDNDNGGYVNRLNNQGDRYTRPPAQSGLRWCSDQSNNCAACEPGYTQCYGTCTPWGNTQTCADYPQVATPVYVDGNPLFFPVDRTPPQAEDSVANIPQEVYGGGWQADPSGIARNFFFTSEITYWFEYHAGDTANLTFVGDDDVWVFVNRRLAVDLGGLHVPIEGSFTLNANGTIDMLHGAPANTASSTTAAFGLEDGGVYEIKVFQAERKKTGSSFKLTLSGFNTARSECVPTCGDGIIAAGEQCDDGVENNVGGHNRCNPDCTIGSYCGDGIVQEGVEECDDAAPDAPPNCAGCRIIVVL
jgi:fibro-slime domain-containing protein